MLMVSLVEIRIYFRADYMYRSTHYRTIIIIIHIPLFVTYVSPSLVMHTYSQNEVNEDTLVIHSAH